MLSKKHISSQLKKWGFASCHDDVHDKLNKGVLNFVKRLSAGQKGGRVVLPSEWFGVDSGRYSASSAPTNSLDVSDAWIRPPMQASDPTGGIVGGKQKGGRIVQSSEWYGVDSGRYSADANQGSSLAVSEAWIRPPMQASDPTGAIVGGGGRKFVVTQKALQAACKTAGVVLASEQKKVAKSALEDTLSKLFDSVAKKTKSENHLSLASFEQVWKQRKYNKLR
jgi:hypothetical protein